MTRFFVTRDRIADGRVVFDGDDSHHIAVVLKMRVSDSIVALDNEGAAYTAVLDIVGKNRTEAQISNVTYPAAEPTVHITVAQAVPKTLERLEWVLQHGTEIGVTRFVLFKSTHSRPDSDRLERKIDRWREIVKTAAEQSGRTRLPAVVGIVSFDEMLALAQTSDLKLLPYEAERNKSLREALQHHHPSSVFLAIGPEGGYSESEAVRAQGENLVSVTLGPRILRTETAALTAVSQILFALDADNGVAD